ncbi:defensin beta 136 [Talpa occidentalis]|uniref:defensin beta 136 n=1 Tax=Talpa occidentalis TaxID=50954 RepID=UPI00188FEA3A|nr:defensin beta 136 [Talpa occidentalis]
MTLCLSGLLFLLAVCLPSGQAMLGNSGVEFNTCTKLEGRCFFGCPPGWQWVSHCHSLMSCCKELKKNKPAHYYDVEN